MTKREKWLCELTKQRIADALQEDLSGGESLMKEVWEACKGPEDWAAVEAQMRVIIKSLRPEQRVPWSEP